MKCSECFVWYDSAALGMRTWSRFGGIDDGDSCSNEGCLYGARAYISYTNLPQSAFKTIL